MIDLARTRRSAINHRCRICVHIAKSIIVVPGFFIGRIWRSDFTRYILVMELRRYLLAPYRIIAHESSQSTLQVLVACLCIFSL